MGRGAPRRTETRRLPQAPPLAFWTSLDASASSLLSSVPFWDGVGIKAPRSFGLRIAHATGPGFPPRLLTGSFLSQAKALPPTSPYYLWELSPEDKGAVLTESGACAPSTLLNSLLRIPLNTSLCVLSWYFQASSPGHQSGFLASPFPFPECPVAPALVDWGKGCPGRGGWSCSCSAREGESAPSIPLPAPLCPPCGDLLGDPGAFEGSLRVNLLMLGPPLGLFSPGLRVA